jgi:AmiR/NasT family two-component response regulator
MIGEFCRELAVLGFIFVPLEWDRALAGLGFAIAERHAARKLRAEAEVARRKLAEAALIRSALQAMKPVSKAGTESLYNEISQGETYHLTGTGR